MENLWRRPTALVLLCVSIIIRLLPHPANFTPVGATALFGGSKLARPWNYFLPLAIMFSTDIFLGFHSTIPYVYGSFLLIVFLSERFLQKTSYLRISILAVINSWLFFLITNFGVWLQGALYPPTFAGLLESYLMGLPFLRNMLLGDLIFALGFFWLYETAVRSVRVRAAEKRLQAWLAS